MSTDDPARQGTGVTPSFVALDEAEAFRVPAERALPAVPPWVADPVKWQSLSRADRRALERHHRRQGKHR